MPLRKRPIIPEVGQTDPKAGRLLLPVFLAVVALPALVQVVLEPIGWFDKVDPKTGKVTRDRKVQALDLILKLDDLDIFRETADGDDDSEKRTLLKHIEDFESELESRSIASNAAQPLTQWVQLTLGKQGNEKVVLGSGGWLFYRPGISFVTGKGFVGSRALRPNEEEEFSYPLPAILKFHEDLKGRGIELVVVPIPVKATIYPERLTGHYDASQGPPVNLSLRGFFRKLEDSGVTVIDLTQELWNARNDGELYLPYDSHWTPKGMSVFAEALARKLKERFEYLQDPTDEFKIHPVQVTNRGDIFNMLKLPSGSQIFEETTVTTHQVHDTATRKPVESDESSRLVFLGDSAANIYSVGADMNWGDHAGLPEHLCLHLGRTIHWIAVNGGGPSLTRQKLIREGLERKNVVVWEFLMRDLSHPIQDWEDVPLPSEPMIAAAAGPLEVKARIKKLTRPPEPDSSELYPNTIIYTLYEVLEVIDGTYEGKELVAVEWAQRDLDFLEPFEYRRGDEHHMVLTPLKEAEKKDRSIRQAQFVDDAKRYDLVPYWVVEHKEQR